MVLALLDQEIRGRLLHAPKWRKQQQQEEVAPITPTSDIQIDSPQQQPCFIKVLVRNLPPHGRLQYFFSKHGKVSSAEVRPRHHTALAWTPGNHGDGAFTTGGCSRCSQRTGQLLIFHFLDVWDESSIDPFLLTRNDWQVLDGCSLQVSLVKKKRKRRHTPSTA